MSETAEITDAEIRDWARATGEPVGVKGRISAELRRKYETLAAEAERDPGAAAPAAAASPLPPKADPESGRGSESVSPAPPVSRQETAPRKVRPAGSGIRARVRRWSSGSRRRAPGSRPRPRARGPRVSCESLIAGVWEGSARLLQPVNLPLSRCLAWQADTAGPVLDDAIKGTFVDALAQPLARMRERIGAVADFVGPPGLVVALQLPAAQPFRQEIMQQPDGTSQLVNVPWPAGAVRQQLLMGGLAQSLARNVERQEQLPAAVREKQKQREQLRADMREVIEIFFAPPESAGPAGAAAEEEAMARAREHLRGEHA